MANPVVNDMGYQRVMDIAQAAIAIAAKLKRARRDAETVARLRDQAQIHHRFAAGLKHGQDLRVHHLRLSRAYSETADAIERGEVGDAE